ncbi:MAG: UbiX family flavin prenyltransferase [Candidatus Acidiferrales bacterium]
MGKVITVGVTGASGAVLARTALRMLEYDARVERVHLVVTEAGQRLLAQELGVRPADAKLLPALLSGTPAGKIELLPDRDIGASIASGSHPVDGMVVIPCSAGTLASIANGTSEDLLARAADVCLKERRPLVLCLRETPLNRVHLQNMLRAQEAGAVIMPVIPAFYFAPQTIDELVEQFVCRALAALGLPQEQQYRWEGQAKGRAQEA